MAPEPSAKSLAKQATWAVFRESVARMTQRQRAGLRLYLLRQQTKQGDHRAAKQAEVIAAQLRRDDAIDACAAEIRTDEPGLTQDQASYLAEAALSNSETDNHE